MSPFFYISTTLRPFQYVCYTESSFLCKCVYSLLNENSQKANKVGLYLADTDTLLKVIY